MKEYTFLSDVIENNDNKPLDKIVERWEKLGFLEGFPEEHKEILAVNYENMARYLVYEYEDDMECLHLDTIMFPLVRRTTSKVPIKMDARMLVYYTKNATYDDIKPFISETESKGFIKFKEEMGDFNKPCLSFFYKTNEEDVFSNGEKIGTQIPYGKISEKYDNADIEAELCALISEYIVNKMRK